jgi:hypothetical protein
MRSVTSHLIALRDGWSAWKWVAVRAAGFPVNLVRAFDGTECSTIAASILELEAAIEADAAEALAIANRHLKSASGASYTALARSKKRFAKRRAAAEGDVAAWEDLAERNAALAARSARLEAAVADLPRAYAEQHARDGAHLRALCADPRFREALIWQNRRLLKGGLDSLVRHPAGTADSRTRSNELLVASYLQRYATKNDTIGFFGPIGWGTVGTAAAPVTARPGTELVRTRATYFEHWSLEALARALDRQIDRKRVRPRRLPMYWVDGTTLHHPIGRRSTLPIEFARVLSACDGMTPASEIASSLARDPSLDLGGEDEVFEILEQLADRGMINWKLEVPSHLPDPEAYLRELLAGSVASLETLDALVRSKDRVHESRSPDELDEAMADLEGLFEATVSERATRNEGKVYAGRTLVYQDCVRDLDLELGAPFVEAIAGPLALLCSSARWLTARIADRYRDLFVREYRALASERGQPQVDYVSFWQRVEGSFGGPGAPTPEMIRPVLAELQEAWTAILGVDFDAETVVRRTGDIEERVRERFDVAAPGWPMARYHAPDILVSARGLDAFQRGEFLVVLGELHVGTSTLMTPFRLRHHPSAGDLIRCFEEDLGEGRWIIPVIPSERTSRADPHSVSPRDLDLETGEARSWRPRDRSLAVGSLFLEEVEGRLWVTSRELDERFEVTAFFAHFMCYDSIQRFSILPAAAHTPRITIDRVVVARETWRFDPEDVPFARLEAPVDRFLGARRFQKARGLPRHVFIKVPEEPKPCYADFDSPIFVELLCRILRRASRITLSEMLPGLDESWVTGGSNERYTCELRMTVLDPEPWSITRR